MKQKGWFEQFSKIAAKFSGRSGTFAIACTVVGITKGAHNALLDLEDLTEQEQDYFRGKYEALALEAQKSMITGKSDTDSPELRS